MLEWLSVKEATEASGYHPDYIREFIRRNQIEAEKKGRTWWVDMAACVLTWRLHSPRTTRGMTPGSSLSCRPNSRAGRRRELDAWPFDLPSSTRLETLIKLI